MTTIDRDIDRAAALRLAGLLAPRPGQQHETVVALLDALHKTRRRLNHHGDLLMQRTVDWRRNPTVPPPSLTDVELEGDGRTDTEIEDAEGDVAASRYADEVRALASRIRTDLARLVQIDAIVIRDQPKRLDGRDMMLTQVAAAGLCVSCWRYDQTNKDREKDRHDHFHNKEACDRCAAFKHLHGIYPPVVLLEAWHTRGKNWTVPMVEAALLEARRAKSS